MKHYSLFPQMVRLLSLLAGLALFFICFIIFFLLVDIPVAQALKGIYSYTFVPPGKTFMVIVADAVPLAFSGLAVAIALRCGLFNIGVEGQYFIGGLVAALVGIYLPLPTFLHVPFVVLGAMVGGMAWAAIPAILRVKLGAHEVVTTIMFNNIAIALVAFLVNGVLGAETAAEGVSLAAQTKTILPTAIFENITWFFRSLGMEVPNHVPLDYSFFLAILAAILFWLFFTFSPGGFRVKAVGLSPKAAEYGGILADRLRLKAFLMSGAVGGLIGLHQIFGEKGYYTYDLRTGLGFDGIAIALVGRNSALGVVLTSLLFAFSRRASYSLQLNFSLPGTVSLLFTGVLVLTVLIGDRLASDYLKRRQRERTLGGGEE